MNTSDLNGKNNERRRATDKRSYKFQVAGETYRGSLQTHDKPKAEEMAKQLKGQKLIDAGTDDVDIRLSRLEDALFSIRTDLAALRADVAALLAPNPE